MLTKCRKAQSTLEYALLVGVVVGVLLTMQNYLKRSMQGKLQSTADEMGEQYSPGDTKRHERLYSAIDKVTETSIYGKATDTSGEVGRTRTVIKGGKQEQEAKRESRGLDRERWEHKRDQP